MGIREIAIAVAAEVDAKDARLREEKDEQAREAFAAEARQWLATQFYDTPDELIASGATSGHVRWEDLWFSINKDAPFRLHPSEACPTKAGTWHFVDASLFGVTTSTGLRDLVELGRYLARLEAEAALGRRPSVSRCNACDEALGQDFDGSGNRWIGYVPKLGDLPRLAAQLKKPVDDTWPCPDHGDACVSIAECAENHGHVFHYPSD